MDDPNKNDSKSNQPKGTVEDVQRVLEVGRLLKSVLTEEELEELAKTINASKNETK
jgi:electron transfer flavoprotein alpha subunit